MQKKGNHSRIPNTCETEEEECNMRSGWPGEVSLMFEGRRAGAGRLWVESEEDPRSGGWGRRVSCLRGAGDEDDDGERDQEDEEATALISRAL
jgi:hypothetical protein